MGGGPLHTGAAEVAITGDLQGPPDLVLPQASALTFGTHGTHVSNWRGLLRRKQVKQTEISAHTCGNLGKSSYLPEPE